MIDTVDAAAFEAYCDPVAPADFIDLLRQVGFSPKAYLDAHGDLVGLNRSPQHALAHLFRHGLDERRTAPLTLDRQVLVALARLPILDGIFKAKLLTYLARHLFDNVDRLDGTAIAACWPAIRDLAREGGRPYFVAGDSHSGHYALTGTKYDAWLLPIHLLCSGGSASGLGSPASRSGYGGLLRQVVQVIATLPGAGTLPFLLQFGQVDLEFIYHFRRVRDGARALNLDDYRAFCDATLARYIQFVTTLFPTSNRAHVLLVSVFPPVLSDAAWQAGYVNADIANQEAVGSVDALRAGIRTLEFATLLQRTEIHAYYNDGLRSMCRQHGFGYLDGMTSFLGADGTVDPRFVIPETRGSEHHLDLRQTYDVLRGLVWRRINATGQVRTLADARRSIQKWSGEVPI